tara:strand:+ start:3012 stop:3608 length:597 start_codon:yes stop_codon:yes gene_type:complete
MAFEINLGSDGSSKGEGFKGFFSWSARGTQDGIIPPQKFYLNSDGEKTVCEEISKTGILFDIYNLRTGWQRFSGSGVEWVWNDDLIHYKPKPEGDDWKQGFEVMTCIGKDQTAVWSQSGTASMRALSHLSKQLSKADGKLLPLVKHTGTEPLKFKSGTSTAIPTLEVVKWLPRPSILEEIPKVAASDGEDVSLEDLEF